MIIQNANKIAFENQDRVKAFKSKLMMCDNIDEIKKQKKLQKVREKRDKDIEEGWMQLEKQYMRDYDDNLKKKLKAEYQKKMDNAKSITKQLNEFRNRYVKQMQEDFLEGELLKKQVEDDIEAARQKELDQIEANKRIQADQINANRQLEEIKLQQKQKEIQEDKDIQKFAKKKDRLDQLRREKEKDR